MTMAIIITDAAAIEAVRHVNCVYCWAGPGDACGLIPEGDHFARWCWARRKGLVTAEQVGAALDTLTVITDGALVVTEALSPAVATGTPLAFRETPSRPGPMTAGQPAGRPPGVGDDDDTAPLSPAAALDALGAVWSDDFDAYASGELDISQVHCALCQCAPCRCPAFGTPEYFALIDFRHGRGGAK